MSWPDVRENKPRERGTNSRGIKCETQAGIYRTLGALLRGLDFI